MQLSDFDLLCAGASPEETKRLCKLLDEWCAGDENGFPAQLALLTRAQWRVAATVPGSVNDARKLLEAKFAEQCQQLAKVVRTFEVSTAARIGDLKQVVEEQAKHSVTMRACSA